MKILFGIFILFNTFNMAAQATIAQVLENYNSGKVPYISVEELRMKQLDHDIIIVDAREYEEFEISHLKSAKYVGYRDFNLDSLKAIPKDAEIAVYCSIGIRSEDIAQKMKKAGYEKVVNVYGGIFQWKNKGYPVFDLKGKETEKIHAYSEKWAKYLENAEKVY